MATEIIRDRQTDRKTDGRQTDCQRDRAGPPERDRRTRSRTDGPDQTRPDKTGPAGIARETDRQGPASQDPDRQDFLLGKRKKTENKRGKQT